MEGLGLSLGTWLLLQVFWNQQTPQQHLTSNDKAYEINVDETWNPHTSFSDNGLEFTVLEFRKFSANWDFEYDTSSQKFAQLNSMVEKTIQTVKRTLLKCLKLGDDKYLALLALRTAPSKENTIINNKTDKTLASEIAT